MVTYLHDLTPFAFKITDGFGIRWYGLSYLLGFLCAYFFFNRWAKQGRISLTGQQIGDFVFAVAIGTILGGRLGYCLFYDQALFTKVSDEFPYWGVLQINKGGMASHGGVVGIILSCYYFAKSRKLSFKTLLDIVAITAALGIFFGRIANFVNGELYGRAVEVSAPFAVQFPQEMYHWSELEPEKLHTLASIAEQMGVTAERWNGVVKATPDSYLIYDTIDKVNTRVQQGDLTIQKMLKEVLPKRHPSQLYQAVLEGLLIFCILLFIFYRFPIPGLTATGFLMLYPIARFIGEQFRMPDPQLGYQLLHLTRGQWLSVGMFMLAAVFCFFLLRKDRQAARAE